MPARADATRAEAQKHTYQQQTAPSIGGRLMPTIAVVDDDRNIQTSVSIALEAESFRTRAYFDGVSALQGFRMGLPDLAILEIKMPRMDGMELLRRLRQTSGIPVIFLTCRAEEMDELFCLRNGADDFIRKPFSPALLVERVKALLRRTPHNNVRNETGAEAFTLGHLHANPEGHICTWKGKPVTLTVNEFLILQALASRPGVVETRQALMDATYADHVYVDDRAIDAYVQQIRRKFKAVDSGFDMIDTLYGIGYRFRQL